MRLHSSAVIVVIAFKKYEFKKYEYQYQYGKCCNWNTTYLKNV